MWRPFVRTSRSPDSRAAVRCTASPVRRKRSRGAVSINSLVLRSRASLTGIRFRRPSSKRLEKSVPMQGGMEFGKRPEGGVNLVRAPDKRPHLARSGFIEVELRDI
jgi:hypothetical protein